MQIEDDHVTCMVMFLFSTSADQNVISYSHYIWDTIVNFIQLALENILRDNHTKWQPFESIPPKGGVKGA
jgi:hypothetical protein